MVLKIRRRNPTGRSRGGRTGPLWTVSTIFCELTITSEKYLTYKYSRAPMERPPGQGDQIESEFQRNSGSSRGALARTFGPQRPTSRTQPEPGGWRWDASCGAPQSRLPGEAPRLRRPPLRDRPRGATFACWWAWGSVLGSSRREPALLTVGSARSLTLACAPRPGPAPRPQESQRDAPSRGHGPAEAQGLSKTKPKATKWEKHTEKKQPQRPHEPQMFEPSGRNRRKTIMPKILTEGKFPKK